jgi:hypothetical protein
MGWQMMKVALLLLAAFFSCCSGCYYPGTTGRVVNSATGQPIEGAVVVAQWTQQRGIPGLQYHNMHKITETLTDKDGRFALSGTSGLLIDPPEMVIYKAGYIPWRNDLEFPNLKIVKGHEWNKNSTYKLDIISKKYTAQQLHLFLSHGIMGLRDVPIFHKINNDIADKTIDRMKAHKTIQEKT